MTGQYCVICHRKPSTKQVYIGPMKIDFCEDCLKKKKDTIFRMVTQNYLITIKVDQSQYIGSYDLRDETLKYLREH